MVCGLSHCACTLPAGRTSKACWMTLEGSRLAPVADSERTSSLGFTCRNCRTAAKRQCKQQVGPFGSKALCGGVGVISMRAVRGAGVEARSLTATAPLQHYDEEP